MMDRRDFLKRFSATMAGLAIAPVRLSSILDDAVQGKPSSYVGDGFMIFDGKPFELVDFSLDNINTYQDHIEVSDFDTPSDVRQYIAGRKTYDVKTVVRFDEGLDIGKSAEIEFHVDGMVYECEQAYILSKSTELDSELNSGLIELIINLNSQPRQRMR